MLPGEDEKIDTTPRLRQQMEKVSGIIEAIRAVRTSSHWKLLKEEVLDGVVEVLYRRLKTEKNEVDIHRLQGQLVSAEKYADLEKMEAIYSAELEKLRQQLNAAKNPRDGAR